MAIMCAIVRFMAREVILLRTGIRLMKVKLVGGSTEKQFAKSFSIL